MTDESKLHAMSEGVKTGVASGVKAGARVGAKVSAEVGQMGLKGIMWTNVANASALVIIGVLIFLFYRDSNRRYDAYVAEAKEERVMFRDELKTIRADQREHWDKTERTHQSSMGKMGATIERAVVSLETALKVVESHRRVGMPDEEVGDPGG